MSESLKNKTVKGVGWSFADNIANSGVTFLVGIVLARLLSPEEFGLLGMIAVFIAISNSIVDSGFSSALIRKGNVSDIDYSTVFYFNIALGVVFYIFLYLLSPVIATFFNEPKLILITRIMGFVLVINSFAIIQRTILVKKIDFKTQTKISFIASMTAGVVGILMALKGFGVWSLVGQQIIKQLLNTLCLWLYNSWIPTLKFSEKSFYEMFGFGSKLMLIGLIDTIYNNLYYIIIGRFYKAEQLGQYTRADQFNSIFSINLTSVIQRVSYPVLSSIQEEDSRLREAYRKIVKTTMLISFVCMLGLAAIAKPLIIILIGEKWLEAVSFLQIICFSGMLYPLHAINLNMLQVKGRSDLCLKLELIKKVIAIFPILLGIFCGIKYMLWGAVVSSIIAFFINSYYSARLINYSTTNQLFDLYPLFFPSILIAAVVWAVSFLDMNIYVMFLTQFFLGWLLICLVFESLKNETYLDIKKVLLSLIKR